jgi:lipopolysaccharide/colanic/teichoic acid biosynthesis glycosyltransferase
MGINFPESQKDGTLVAHGYVVSTPSRGSLYRRFGKRAFDICLAFLLLPVITPLVALLWVVVSRDGGEGFFGHRRVGSNGKVFKCWKLRTMVVNAERKLHEHLANDPDAAAEWERDRKLTNDPRITPLGDFLRRSSLDELPQIWNVLKGDMSFVGPRPIVRTELHKYGPHKASYLAMKPGITGLWQVSGRNDVCYNTRVKLDVAYQGSASLITDIRIIALTALAVFGATGR